MATFNLRFTVTDAQGNSSAPLTVPFEITNAPVLSAAVISPISAVAGTQRIVTFTATDADGGPLTYQGINVETGQPVVLTPTAQPNVYTFIG